MHSNWLKMILVPLAALGFAALVTQACGGTEGTDTSGGGRCIPGSTQQCFCDNQTTHVQTCQADGTYDACPCTGGSTSSGSGGSGGGPSVTCMPGGGMGILCGNGMIDPGEECDDGNCDPTDKCTDKCKNAICGDKIVQAGVEDCDDGQNEVGDMCPDTCQYPCDAGTVADDAGNCVPVDPCAGKLIFSGLTMMEQPSQWSYMGDLGYGAGTKMCQAIGAAGVCDYEQLKEVLTNLVGHPGDVAKLQQAIADGVTIDAWVNRTTTEMVGGAPSLPGPGGRCNDWTYATNHISDGEWVSITRTGANFTHTFNLDPDTVFTPTPMGHTQADLQCGGEMRYIPCCYPVCVK